jgi:hypothetical protein
VVPPYFHKSNVAFSAGCGEKSHKTKSLLLILKESKLYKMKCKCPLSGHKMFMVETNWTFIVMGYERKLSYISLSVYKLPRK